MSPSYENDSICIYFPVVPVNLFATITDELGETLTDNGCSRYDNQVLFAKDVSASCNVVWISSIMCVVSGVKYLVHVSSEGITKHKNQSQLRIKARHFCMLDRCCYPSHSPRLTS